MYKSYISEETLKKYEDKRPKNFIEMINLIRTDIYLRDNVEYLQLECAKSIIGIINLFDKFEDGIINDVIKNDTKRWLLDDIGEILLNFIKILSYVNYNANKNGLQIKNEIYDTFENIGKVPLQFQKWKFENKYILQNYEIKEARNKISFLTNLVTKKINLDISKYDYKPDYFSEILIEIIDIINKLGFSYNDVLNSLFKNYIFKVEPANADDYTLIRLNDFGVFNDKLKKETFEKVLLCLKDYYPNVKEWLEKVFKEDESENSGRKIFTLIETKNSNFSLVGILILKDTEEEKKICTLLSTRVIGVEILFKKAVEILKTSNPIITLNKKIYDISFWFKEEFRKYNFKLTSQIKGLYLPNDTEYIFNENEKKEIELND